jgi:hypothetical protein
MVRHIWPLSMKVKQHLLLCLLNGSNLKATPLYIFMGLIQQGFVEKAKHTIFPMRKENSSAHYG